MPKPRRRSSFVFPVVAAVALAGCAARISGGGSGNVSTKPRTPVAAGAQARPAPEFTRIEVRGPIDVEVHEGRSRAIAVTIDEQYQDRVKTIVNGDTLVVDYDEPARFCIGLCRDVGDDAKVIVDLPSLRSAKIEGSGDVHV
ncbi:MAG TPA: DUF2807 domain-containing protein, partial [Polyangiaceae bacterium]